MEYPYTKHPLLYALLLQEKVDEAFDYYIHHRVETYEFETMYRACCRFNLESSVRFLLPKIGRQSRLDGLFITKHNDHFRLHDIIASLLRVQPILYTCRNGLSQDHLRNFLYLRKRKIKVYGSNKIVKMMNYKYRVVIAFAARTRLPVEIVSIILKMTGFFANPKQNELDFGKKRLMEILSSQIHPHGSPHEA